MPREGENADAERAWIFTVDTINSWVHLLVVDEGPAVLVTAVGCARERRLTGKLYPPRQGLMTPRVGRHTRAIWRCIRTFFTMCGQQ